MSNESLNDLPKIPADSLMEFVYNEKICDYELKIDELEQKCKTLQDENSILQQKKRDENEIQQKVTLEMAAMQEDLESHRMQRIEMEHKISKLELIVANAQKEKDDYEYMYKDQKAKHLVDIKELQQKCQQLEDEVENLRQQHLDETQVHPLQAVPLNISSAQEELQCHMNLRNEMEQTTFEIAANVARIQEERDRCDAEIENLSAEIEELRRKCQGLVDENAALSQKQTAEAELKEAFAVKISAMQEDLDSHMKLRIEMEQKISELELNLLHTQEERDRCRVETEKRSAELQEKICALNNEVESLQQRQINESQVHQLQTLPLKIAAMQEDFSSHIKLRNELEQKVSELELELKRKTAECHRLGDMCDKFDEEEAGFNRKLLHLYEENMRLKRKLEEDNKQQEIMLVSSRECPESSNTLLDVCSPIAKRRAPEEKTSPSNRSNCKQQ